MITIKNNSINHTFFKDKGYKYNLFINFNPRKISPMCQVINHYVDLIDFTMFKDFDKTNQIAGGRPRYKFESLLKIYLYSQYMGTSFRQLEVAFTYGTEFSYLNDGLEGHPKKSTMSNFASILDNQIENVFFQLMQIFKNEFNLDFEHIYCDGSVYEAWNDRHKIITKENLKKSNTRHKNILRSDVSSEHKKKSEDKLRLNDKYFEKIMNLGTNSFGLTDDEAVIMRDKNNSFIAGYNVQLFEEDQFGLIIFANVSNLTPDASAFIQAFEKFKTRYQPLIITTDKGYSTTEIAKLLRDHGVALITKQRNKNFKDLHSDWKIADDYQTIICPCDRVLYKLKSKAKTFSQFTTKTCAGCHMNDQCLNESRKKKLIYIDIEKLMIDDYIKSIGDIPTNSQRYNQRGNKSESPFGFTKYNINGKKFKRKGLKKNTTTIYLLSILYNLSRIINIKTKE